MKRLLTAAAMAITLSGVAQNFWFPIDNIPIGSMDTVKVALLISDTAHQYKTYYKSVDCDTLCLKTSKDKSDCFIEIKEDLGAKSRQVCFSEFGYIVYVRQKFIDSPGTVCASCPNFWHFVCYLDSDKRPLNKNYIVWNHIKTNL